MTSVGAVSVDRSAYPRQGRVAVLCEGDLSGYEADLLAKWTGRESMYVDVWPCGTQSALLGVADAIGRSVPIVIVEDRDFRLPAAAEKDCKEQMKSRTRRDVLVVAWRAWARHEIENYLIEPDVLARPLAGAFRASVDQVRHALDEVVRASGADQAARCALYEFAEQLPDPSHYKGDSTGRIPRLTLDDDSQEFRNPDPKEWRDAVTAVLGDHKQRYLEKAGKLALEPILDRFEVNLAEWSTESIGGIAWRVDWGGKETLHRLYRLLSARYGWVTDDDEWEPVRWQELAARREDGPLLRSIERTLHRDVVGSFLEYARNEVDPTITDEWRKLGQEIATAARL